MGNLQTLIWEGNAADYLSWGKRKSLSETPVNTKIKENPVRIIADSVRNMKEKGAV